MTLRLLVALGLVLLSAAFACSASDDGDGDVDQETVVPVATATARPLLNTPEPGRQADWIYWLSDIDLGAIASHGPGVAVIDYSRDGGLDSEFTRSEIESLRSSMSGDRLVISYMSIGEAEDYRYYWQDSWASERPGWLEDENRNWPGNFKVKFWEPDWQALILGGPDSYLDKIIAAGFDGVYLDIVDAYDYFTERGRDSAEDEMVRFVSELSEYAKSKQPGFLVFPQNAPELGVRADWLEVVDGIGIEGVYFGWDAPNKATGTGDRQWLEEQLARFVDAGKTVLAVDYASDASDITEAYSMSRDMGFLSTVTHVDLDRLPSPTPYPVWPPLLRHSQCVGSGVAVIIWPLSLALCASIFRPINPQQKPARRRTGKNMAPHRRILIMGAGGIGSVVGGLLSKSGQDVTLVDQWVEHVEAIKQNGLVVETRWDTHKTRPRALHLYELAQEEKPFDMAFIAVKSYDTDWATMFVKPYVDPENGIFVDFQNGINDERVATVAGAERTLGCIITISAAVYEPGIALRTDENELGYKIAEQDGSDTPRARELVEIMQAAGETEFTDDLWGDRWSKLMVNCMNNALAGISGYGTAETRTNTDTRRAGIQLGAEVARVAKAHGHRLHAVLGLSPEMVVDAAEGRNVEEVESMLLETARKAGSGGVPSFGQDVRKGRRTEIDFLNGYVSEKGREVNVPTPFNDRIVKLVHELGIGFDGNPAHLKPLVEMLP